MHPHLREPWGGLPCALVIVGSIHVLPVSSGSYNGIFPCFTAAALGSFLPALGLESSCLPL